MGNFQNRTKNYNENILINSYFDLNFNVYKYNLYDLKQIVLYLFIKLVDLEKIGIIKNSLIKFIHKISQKYNNNNSFHNFYHAVSVLQFTYLMITIIKDKIEITELQIFALMLASLIHDVDHPGNNNIFEINSRSKLALIYNDISILENHHCSIGFKIMCMNSIQLLKNLSKNDYNEVREIIIFSILATDMIFHQELINKLEKNNTWNYKLICKMIIHAADLSNQIRPFEILKEGSENLRIEYINQKNNETILNLPITPMLDVKDNKKFYIAEYNFCYYIIKPYWNIIVKKFPCFQYILFELEQNIIKWKELIIKHYE
jgi:hypothetical protein